MMKRSILCHAFILVVTLILSPGQLPSQETGGPRPIQPQAPGIASSHGVHAKEESSTAKIKEYFLQQAKELCDRIKKSKPEDLSQKRTALAQLLRTQIPQLHHMIGLSTSPENAQGWKSYLMTNEVLNSLNSGKTDQTLLESSLQAFKSGEAGLDNAIFAPARKTLTELVALNLRISQDAKAAEKDQKIVEELCEKIPGYVGALSKKYDANQAELITYALEDLKYYRPGSNDVRHLVDLISAYFPVPNFMLSVSSRFWKEGPIRPISEDFKINDIIRGASVTGDGKATGTLSAAFVPNDQVAELLFSMATNVQSTTVASREGAYVYSRSSGNVAARKSLFFGKDITANRATATGALQSQITGINSGRRAMGQSVAEQRVMEEKPYSEMESSRKMEYRIASRLDEEIDSQVAELNKRFQDRFITPLTKQEYFPRAIESRTTTDRLFWSALVANDVQLGLPQTSRGTKDGAASGDLSLLIHESCPNNATFFAFAGNRVSDQEVREQMVALFPELKRSTPKEPEKTDAKPKDAKDDSTQKLDKNDDTPLWLSFTEDLPVVTRFDKNEIVVVTRTNQFEKDDRTYPGLNINIVYEIAKSADGKFVLRKKSMEVVPLGHKPGQVIPARYQAIRSMVMKRLEEQLDKEIPIKPIDTSTMGKDGQQGAQMIRKGTLIPKRFTAKNGWLELEYRFAD